jgi:hypothetical protein
MYVFLDFLKFFLPLFRQQPLRSGCQPPNLSALDLVVEEKLGEDETGTGTCEGEKVSFVERREERKREAYRCRYPSLSRRKKERRQHDLEREKRRQTHKNAH